MNITKKHHKDAGSFIVFAIGTVVSAAVIGLIVYSLMWSGFKKEYYGEVGTVLTGTVTVYAKEGDQAFELNDANRRAMARIATSGSITYDRKSDKSLDKVIYISSVDKVSGETRRLTLTKTEKENCRVLIENENGVTVAMLTSIKFSAFERLIFHHAANGDNYPVDEMP